MSHLGISLRVSLRQLDGHLLPLVLADSDRLHWIAILGGCSYGWHELFPGTDMTFIGPDQRLVIEIRPVHLADPLDVDVDVDPAADRPPRWRRLLVRLGQLIAG